MHSEICLIRPPAVESFRFATGNISPPLGLAYVAAALERAEYRIEVIDAIAEGPKTTIKYIKGFLVGLTVNQIVEKIPPDCLLIGISCIFTHEWPVVVSLITAIKNKFPYKIIVLGGEHVTALAEFSLATSKADIIVMGEGEETIVELVTCIQNGDDFQDLTGIAFRAKSGDIVANKRRFRNTNINQIPWPAWHLFDLKAYFENEFTGGTDTNEVNVPILATRGCPYQCTFCSSPNMWTTSWIPRDPIDVANEIEFYYNRFNAKNFPFQDLTAIIKRDWIRVFCQEIIKRELPITWQFPSGTRSEAIDDEIANLLYKSGMINIAYAPESGSEHTRKLIKKKMSTETLLDSIRYSINNNLNVSLFYVLGFPHDTIDDMEQCLEFAKKVRALGISDLPVGIFFAIPGTQLFDTLYDTKKIKMDKDFFIHMFQASELLPTRTYCRELNSLQLAKWRFKILWAFYSQPKGTTVSPKYDNSLFQILKGFYNRNHSSRLQTALRHGFKSFFILLSTYFSPRWIPKEEEKIFFNSWNDIYDEIRKQKLENEIIVKLPSDIELYSFNVIKKTHLEHKALSSIRV